MSEEVELGSPSNEAKEEFSPSGIRVLAVDDDAVSLKMLETLLLKCGYKVTASQHALVALRLLQDNKGNYDIVITDVNMPDMDGFELLKTVVSMNLPVIMLSADGEVSTVMKGIEHGACDYLIKPLRLELVQHIWKHVVKKSLQGTKCAAAPETPSKSDEDNTSTLQRECKDQSKDAEDEADENSDEDLPSQKRPRIAWTVERHENFKAAINKLGLDRAVPKKILDLMGDPQLTRENVASHLQKYRKTLKKSGHEVIQHYYSLGVGSSGAGARSLPFNNRVPNLCPIGGFRVEGCQDQRMIPFAPRTSAWAPPPLNLQSNLRQHLPSTNQASALRPHSFGYASNPLVAEAGIQPATSNRASYQAVVPRVDQPNSYMESSSQIRWPREAISSPSSINQPAGYFPDQQGLIDSVFLHHGLEKSLIEEAIVAGFDGVLPKDSKLGDHVNGDLMDPGSIDNGRKPSNEINSPDMLLPCCLDPSHEEPIFHLARSQSAEDLHTAIKQFQESKEIAEGRTSENGRSNTI